MASNSDLAIISVAHSPVLPVWKYTSRLLHERFPQAIKVLVAPSGDIPSFQKVTCDGFLIVSEEEIMEPWAEKFESASREGLANRRGWFLQQLLKVQALIDYSDSVNLLVWDADTLPLRDIDFFSQGIPKYFLGTERNQKYFETIEKILGPVQPFKSSFIAQCFPIRGADVKLFAEFLEERHGVGALEALIDSIDFSHPASFSEYETLGAYVSLIGAFHEQPNSNGWSRNGWRRIGSPLIAWSKYKGLEHPDLAFVAFERKPFRYRFRSFFAGLLKKRRR